MDHPVEWFQMKVHDVRSKSSMNEMLVHNIKSDLVYFLFKNIINKVMMRKAKNYKKFRQKWRYYIITAEFQNEIICIKF